MHTLSDISLGIRTFLRDGKLFRSLADIRKNLPELKIIVADDGEQNDEKDGVYADLIREGHKVIICDFDKGFGYKSNRIAAALDTELLLVGADDFDFAPVSVRAGIQKMVDVLNERPALDIVSGRLANRGPYEFHLIERQPGEWYERPCTGSEYFNSVVQCDLTVNYSLIHKRVFEKVRWDDTVKICGGEHGAFFIDVKKANFKVAYVPGVEIGEQSGQDSVRYLTYRLRGAHDKSRPCFASRNIKRYVLGNGQVDYDANK